MAAYKPKSSVVVSATAEAEVFIDIVAEVENMDASDARKVLHACQKNLKLAVDEVRAEPSEVGIDTDRGRREIAVLVDKAWFNLSHHAQYVARQLGV